MRSYDPSIPGYVEYPGPQIPEADRVGKWLSEWQDGDMDGSVDQELSGADLSDDGEDQAAVERYVAALPDSDPEDAPSEYEEFVEDDTEEDEDDFRDPTTIVSIKEERVFYNGRSFQRQYRVHRLDPSYNTPRLPWTRAVVLDNIMDRKIIAEWRSIHPMSDIEWKYSGKANNKTQATQRKKWEESETWQQEMEKHLDLVQMSEQ